MHHDKLSETLSKAGRELVYCPIDRYNEGKHKLVTDCTHSINFRADYFPWRMGCVSDEAWQPGQ